MTKVNLAVSRHLLNAMQLLGAQIEFVSAIEREREMFYLTTHSTHFIYGYMASDIWLRTILIVRKETRCRHIGYSYRLAARVLLYAPSHRQDNTYHGLCYTSRGALAGTRNSSMGPLSAIASLTFHIRPFNHKLIEFVLNIICHFSQNNACGYITFCDETLHMPTRQKTGGQRRRKLKGRYSRDKFNLCTKFSM